MDEAIKRGYELIERRRQRWTNEEEVRLAWIQGLEQALGIQLDAERARRDASYNNVVIEFKGPGLFNGSDKSPRFVEAIEDRLLKYIVRLSSEQKIDDRDYIGIAIDGEHIAFAEVQQGKITSRPLLPFSPTTFRMVVDALKAAYRRAITADNLIEDFGHRSPVGREAMQCLADVLSEALNKGSRTKVKMLFEEWTTLYGQAADLSLQQRGKVEDTLGFRIQRSAGSTLPARLFVTHTFYSLLMKLLAAEIVASQGMASSASLVHELLTLRDDAALRAALKRDVEDGAFFTRVGLRGFIEEAVFSWYLDAPAGSPASARLCAAIRNLLAQLSVYRFDSVRHTGSSRDVLRDFYQDLVPEGLRKSLGEFYTPDWLVEHTIARLGFDADRWLQARVLDPTCGSGSFLLEAIANKRRAATDAGYGARAAVEMLIKTVWGFDLNPLAVQASRLNYLIAISDLLGDCKGMDLEIPVLLADAVYSPSNPSGSDEPFVEYIVGSDRVNLRLILPQALAADRHLLDKVFQIMGEQVEGSQPYASVARLLTASGTLTPEQSTEWESPLRETYEQVLTLHKNRWNGIWFRLVRNFFWSATAGRFDVIIGNPPWVRWSNLPEAYRNRAKPTCQRYAIFSDTKFHGGNELDISAIITYTSADKWLAEGGMLVFVITQTVFQSPSSQGFRRFRINASDRLVPLSVDDLKDLRPFPEAANKTAIVTFTKERFKEAAFPLDYRVWKGKARQLPNGRTVQQKLIPSHLSREEVLRRVDILQMEATPVSETMEGSPWAVMKPGVFAQCRALFGNSNWVNGRKGITTDLNGVYFVEVVDYNESDMMVKVRTRPSEGKTDIGSARDFWVEADILFPLAKGAGDIQPCYFKPEMALHAFVPNSGIDKASRDEAARKINTTSLPKTYRFFREYKTELEKRSTYRLRMRNAPFFCVYNVGTYTFAPFKVLWAEMSGNFCAAVATSGDVPGLGKRVYVPDHKLYFAEFQDAKPAYYLCGLLHAELVKEIIEAHHVALNMGDIFKHVSLPPFDSAQPAHIELAALVEKAHAQEDPRERAETVSEIRALAGRIVAGALKTKQPAS